MSKKFDELVSVMARLRAPGGCPWDREQTYQSLAPFLLEEAYEAFDAIQQTADGNTDHLCEELGDVLLQIIFHAQIAEERGDFTVEDVAAAITKKLVLRHPHVFGDKEFATASDVLNNWDKLKKDERAASGKAEKLADSMLDEIPVAFPALLEGQKLTKKAAKVGFDWENHKQVLEKLDEEVTEFHAAVETGASDKIEEEIGDILFVVMNLARKLDVDAETALKKTNRKFRKRFKFIEDELKREQKDFSKTSLKEMDALWNRAKTEKI